MVSLALSWSCVARAGGFETELPRSDSALAGLGAQLRELGTHLVRGPAEEASDRAALFPNGESCNLRALERLEYLAALR